MNKEEILDLLARYEAGVCSEKETATLEQWFATQLHNHTWEWENETERQLVKRAMQRHIESQLFPKKISPVFTLKRIATAAAILIFCATAIGIYLIRRSSGPVEQFYISQAVAPGSNAAQLTLADGKTIWLDDAQTGTVYNQGGIAITKLANGGIDYQVDHRFAKGATNEGNNTISVPRGGQYQITLPDGTKVWLNSATTLTYPVVFAGHERRVSLTGEAYFEVAKNKAMPFEVNANGTHILVTGTEFNVAAYADEKMVKTTLVTGRVEVACGSQKTILNPGQQALSSSHSSIQTKDIDTDYAIAWVNGDFLFEDQDIRTIMKDIARWYNVDVVFEGMVPSKRFGGTYTRSKGLAELLGYLESLSGMHFNLKERRVTVMM
ncbi:iron dicitrate transporter FecR [Parapedobacter defluvii]|uniref:Iron dicitrate transporter FecR n=1 Tax=Parapedobacter defluvii TaxID=2045106 RepID=A0ABQ1L038_9SPHI|nr:FecR domain-containing protein [Parapedobacter defluvii]GGC13082.1 iron dicitrate transporter FecR [Parapedobacter defluvii]